MSDATQALQLKLKRSVAYISNVYKSDVSKTPTEIRLLRTGRAVMEFYQVACDIYTELAGTYYDEDYSKHMWITVCNWAVDIMPYPELDRIYCYYSGRGGVNPMRVAAAGSFINHVRNRYAHVYGFSSGLDAYDISDSMMTMIAVVYITCYRELGIDPPVPYAEFGKQFVNVVRRGVR